VLRPRPFLYAPSAGLQNDATGICCLGAPKHRGRLSAAAAGAAPARGMANYTKHVRSKYNSHIEWFDINLPWAKRDAIEVTIIEPPKAKED